MLNRRLSLTYSDDDAGEEIADHQATGNGSQMGEQDTSSHQSATLPTPNPTPFPSELLEISDEEFIDVADNLSPPSPPLPPPSSGGSVCPIGHCLARLGLRLRREWLDSCIGGLQSAVPRFASLDASGKAKLCFQQFLFSDMNCSGGGVLPDNVASMHLADLAGPFVLQVDEIVNISAPLRGRYHNASCGIKRCLKLSMTDGVHRVFGMEYRPIKALEVFSPAGLKVVICNVHIRRGLMMLVPEVVEVLGGSVGELEAAWLRLVEEVNKPPRGKRTRSGEVPSLATRATLAAWPPNVANVLGSNNSSTSHSANHSVANVSSTSHFANHSVANVSSTSHFANHSTTHHSAANVSSISQSPNYSAANVRGETSVPFGTGTTRRTTEEFNGRAFRESSIHNPSSNNTVDVEEMYMDAVSVDNEDTIPPNPSSNSSRNLSSNNIVDVEEIHRNTVPVHNEPSVVVSNAEDIQMVDELEHLHTLSGDRENPFTYLSSLSGRWATVKETTANVKGKIKCLLTGVKRFHYKQTKTYELQVHVDDGSIISTILIDHDVVQRLIGHPPEEVTAALSSPDPQTVNNMKERLKQFQIFLANFEGTMQVEINRNSPLPVAREMKRRVSYVGCVVTSEKTKVSSSSCSNTTEFPFGSH